MVIVAGNRDDGGTKVWNLMKVNNSWRKLKMILWRADAQQSLARKLPEKFERESFSRHSALRIAPFRKDFHTH